MGTVETAHGPERAMNPILEAKMPAITELCRKYGVAKLEVFGSANTPEFDPERSDFDFIIDFAKADGDLLSRFVGFADALEAELGRSADFVFESKMRPRFRAFIAPQREVLYEAANDTVAAGHS
jgi:predicted nucleotidyltransferase